MFGLTAFAQSSFASLGGNTYLKDVAESVAVTDNFTGPISIPVAVSESTTPGATAYSTHALAAAIQESPTITDSFANTLLALASLNESVAITDVYQQLTGKFVYITETASITTDLSAAGSTYNVSRTETQNIQAFDSTGNIITANVTENAVTADATQTAQLVLNQLVNESITPSDVYAAVAQLVASIIETAPANAYQAGGITSYVNISESAAVTDTDAANNVVSVLITETATPNETQSAGISAVAQILESAAVADTITYTVDTKGIVTGILLTISLSSPLVWEQIDNDQSPVWVEIKD